MEPVNSNNKNRREWVQEIFDSEDNFWKRTYPQKTDNEKIKYWASTLYRNMRQQEESGLDAYAIYTITWLTDVLEKESDFLSMLPNIYNIWGNMFDSNRVDRTIKVHFKKIKQRD